MTLTDAGPMVALLDTDDSSYAACTAQLPSLSAPMVTTWPCFSEAMYLLGRELGHAGQDALWQYVEDGLLTIHPQPESDWARMRVLMAQYHDTPMDLADASLVVAAETLGVNCIFSVDSDFYIYRLADGRALEVIPGPPRRR